MQNVIIKILMTLIGKLLTERFVARMIVIALKKSAKLTSNDVDDEIAESIDEALGRPCD